MKGLARITLMIVSLGLFSMLPSGHASAQKWEGVDAVVIEKIAEEQGRGPKETMFNSLEGDVLLLVFLLGGAAGGFMAGYYYHKLSSQRSEDA